MATDYEAMLRLFLRSRQDPRLQQGLSKLGNLMDSEDGQKLARMMASGGADTIKTASEAMLRGDKAAAKAAMAKLLAYMIDAQPKPGRLLRNAGRGLLLLAALWMMKAAFDISYLLSRFAEIDPVQFSAWTIFLQFWAPMIWSLLSGICVALIFLALGLALKRVLIVMEESKMQTRMTNDSMKWNHSSFEFRH